MPGDYFYPNWIYPEISRSSKPGCGKPEKALKSLRVWGGTSISETRRPAKEDLKVPALVRAVKVFFSTV